MPASYPDLKDKVVLVTGGASGIGAAIVTALRTQGASVQVLDISEEADLCCDVTDTEAVARAFAQVHEHGPLNILVCSAGIGFVVVAMGMFGTAEIIANL